MAEAAVEEAPEATRARVRGESETRRYSAATAAAASADEDDEDVEETAVEDAAAGLRRGEEESITSLRKFSEILK